MKVSICIACHNQGHLLTEAVESCLSQDYSNELEIIVLDDCSSDGTSDLPILKNKNVKLYRSNIPSGTGGAFNKAIDKATGDVVVLLCSDDVFTHKSVVSDIANEFMSNYRLVHVSRYYHQFIGNDRRPVRAWRTNNIMELANNPSGLAFRRRYINGCQMSNKMFVEASTLVSCAILKGDYSILKYDTVAVRIHQSISQSKDYYLKRWTSSPVEEWFKIGGSELLKDHTSLIQIKNNFKTTAVVNECINFIKYRPLNIITPSFWFFAFVAVFTPRFILRAIPDIYRRTIGRLTTREVERP
jgi:glycosyltransferase involved in cell wall biosynthesis